MNQSLAVAVDTGDVTAAVRSSLRFAREGDVMLKRHMAKHWLQVSAVEV
jgi:Uma2 family endonuclease